MFSATTDPSQKQESRTSSVLPSEKTSESDRTIAQKNARKRKAWLQR